MVSPLHGLWAGWALDGAKGGLVDACIDIVSVLDAALAQRAGGRGAPDLPARAVLVHDEVANLEGGGASGGLCGRGLVALVVFVGAPHGLSPSRAATSATHDRKIPSVISGVH